MIWGLDFLGLAKFGAIAKAEFPSGWALGAFTKVDGFGDSLPAVDGILSTGRCPLVRLQLMWRDDHNFTSRDIPFVKNEAKRVKKLIQKYPNVRFCISPVCEHRLSPDKWRPFAKAVQDELGLIGYTLVNSPEKSGQAIDGVINESHHGKPFGTKRAFSYDGANCVDSNVEKDKATHAGAEYFMFWNCQCNGRKSENDKTPRPQRKAYPTSNQIDSWIYLNHKKGSTKLPKDWIYKSHSDQHTDKPTGKDQKPFFVKLPKFRSIELKTRSGQVVAKAPYFGTFTGGGHGYYFSDWGYLIADKAKRIQGDSVCEVWADGKKYGAINPAFRDGVYR